MQAPSASVLDAYRWMGANYALVIRGDRTEPLVALRLDDFAKLAQQTRHLEGAANEAAINPFKRARELATGPARSIDWLADETTKFQGTARSQ